MDINKKLTIKDFENATQTDDGIKEAIKYDFVLDTIADDGQRKKYNELKVDNEFKGIERYFIYKHSDENPNCKPKNSNKNYVNVSDSHRRIYEQYIETVNEYKTKDPDSGGSNLLQEVIKVIYDDAILNLCKNNDNNISTDTMNSAQTTLNYVIKNIVHNLKERDCSEMIDEMYISGKRVRFSNLYLANFVSCPKLKNALYDKLQENYLVANDFLNVYHTIGNHMPVPNGFNAGRKSEYWDLTLLGIYKYYQAEGENTKRKELEEILAEYAIDNCKNWLDHFGSWNNFVKDNFMQPFVEVISEGEDGKDGVYGEPKPLFKKHFEKGHTLPQDDAEINEFLENATARIIARGKRMMKALNDSKDK